MPAHPRLLSLVSISLGLSVGLTTLPTRLPQPAQAQTTQAQSAEAERLYRTGVQQLNAGQWPAALATFQQALALRRQLGDPAGEATTLNNIGLVYSNLGQYAEALSFYQQALAIHQRLGNRSSEGSTLNNLGGVYESQQQFAQALSLYQQALAIERASGNRSGEAITLSNLASVLDQQNRPELAIVFYKQAVTLMEAMRRGQIAPSPEQQESYKRSVTHPYRELAGLLLQKNRTLEAQPVLELIKLRELQEYFQERPDERRGQLSVAYLPQEQRLAERQQKILDQAIPLGNQLAQLERKPLAQRTRAEQTQVLALRQAQQQISAEFVTFLESPEVTTVVQQLRQTTGERNLDLRYFNSLRDNLRRLQQNAVMLYPLVLEDRLELVLVSPNAPPLHRSVAVKREEVQRTVAEFRRALESPAGPGNNVRAPARRLYDWLIKPIEQDLAQAQTQTIIYAPDGQLRYIPLAALYDGEQWLIQRFRLNNITAASLTDLNTPPQAQQRVLAAAFTQGRYNLQVGNRQVVYAGLPFAAREVNNLAALIPGTVQLLDRAFTTAATVPRMNDYAIVHLATHAAFVVGRPEDSFILFGDGERVSLRDVQTWSLPNVDLVVLSACQTGLGGQLGTGEEILGFGYRLQQTGAKATLASLWSVSDGGTQVLMDAFYTALKRGQITKAEALRQAQLALISGNLEARSRADLPASVAERLSHPYYWASFVLIGNGL